LTNCATYQFTKNVTLAKITPSLPDALFCSNYKWLP